MADRDALTEPTGEHWTTVRELWLRKDNEQCESWKDEVQNVLIFSGLFSAIVTAFLIQSQQNLQPDPTQETIQLLRQIAAQTAGQSFVPKLDPGIDAISIWVNVFWFLSLVFSLTTALVGIVSLQWIRSHLRNLTDGADSLGLSYMHSFALRHSYIPLVFASLPILLILGLTFFLLGIIAFLFDLSWPVAIPVTCAIACTFAFLIITTVLPALQPSPGNMPSNNVTPTVESPKDDLDCFPSLYRSPQSLLFVRPRDWKSRSEAWLRKRTKDSLDKMKELSHLDTIAEDAGKSPFQYDTINALLSVKKSRTAESEKQRTALAKCLAEALPFHLSFFPPEDLTDLIPFLPPSKYVPSTVFHQDSAAPEDLSMVALLQIATCKGRPSQSPAIVKACVSTTRWLFERPHNFDSVPENQPLDLISRPSELRHDVLEVLIATLTHFFQFAANFKPDSQSINKTTHTSCYTYWFLVRSAQILSQCSLSQELRDRHAYILDVIGVQLADEKNHDYLFFTASIYAGIIAVSSSEDGHDFLRAVKRYSSSFPRLDSDPNYEQLCEALRADEVTWNAIDRALGQVGPSDTQSALMSGTVMESGGGSGGSDTGPGPGVISSGINEGNSSRRTSLEEVHFSGFGRSPDSQRHGEKLEEIVIHPRSFGRRE